MPVQALNYYIPSINYDPLAETVTFNNHTYSVYTLKKPLSLAKKAKLALKVIGNLFRNKNDQELPNPDYPIIKAVFINSRGCILKATKQEGYLVLQDAHKDLSQNKEFILAATKKNGQAFFIHIKN